MSEMPLRVKVHDSASQVVYTDAVLINGNPLGFVLNFGQWAPEDPGLVRVYCNVHPRMVAYVLVMENRYYAQPGNDGSFRIDNVPAGRYRLHVWHERIPSEVVREVMASASEPELQITLNARGYTWQPHRNKYGRDYPTNAGRERY